MKFTSIVTFEILQSTKNLGNSVCVPGCKLYTVTHSRGSNPYSSGTTDRTGSCLDAICGGTKYVDCAFVATEFPVGNGDIGPTAPPTGGAGDGVLEVEGVEEGEARGESIGVRPGVVARGDGEGDLESNGASVDCFAFAGGSMGCSKSLVGEPANTCDCSNIFSISGI